MRPCGKAVPSPGSVKCAMPRGGTCASEVARPLRQAPGVAQGAHSIFSRPLGVGINVPIQWHRRVRSIFSRSLIPLPCLASRFLAAQNAGVLQAERERGTWKLVLQGYSRRNLPRLCMLSRIVQRSCKMSRIFPFDGTFPCKMCREPRIRGSSSKSLATSLQDERKVATVERNEHSARKRGCGRIVGPT